MLFREAAESLVDGSHLEEVNIRRGFTLFSGSL